MRKKVYIAYTGGTIGMKSTGDGFTPAAGYLQKLMSNVPELQSDILPSYQICEYDPLLDSSNMTPCDWLKIAKDIAANHSEFDGFVILHGTDTMAYTASALPFMLEGLQKPVVITGAQIPLCKVRNDARENLITALFIAGNFKIPEVCLCFGDKLLRGNRAVKVDAESLDAFESPNFPPLGTVGIEIKINWDLVLAPSKTCKPIKVAALHESRVAGLRLFPGISIDIVKNFLQPPIRGLILETYGIGNAPEDLKLISALKTANDRGVVIVNCTQCLKGTVNMANYATGAALAAAGVISGFDMTLEAALAKLSFLLNQKLSVTEIKKMMQTDMRGELTHP
ncbi:MAG: asparaginase [Desulfobacterales bacterium]|jgi:L-asparaginase